MKGEMLVYISKNDHMVIYIGKNGPKVPFGAWRACLLCVLCVCVQRGCLKIHQNSKQGFVIVNFSTSTPVTTKAYRMMLFISSFAT